MNALQWGEGLVLVQVWTPIAIQEFTSAMLVIVWVSVLWPVGRETELELEK